MTDETGTTPRVTHLLESSLYVADLDASRAFYTGLFGFAVMLADARMVALAVPGAGVLLLFRRGAARDASVTPLGAVPGHDGGGTLHLCFGIPAAELDAWAGHLAARGIAEESRITWPNGGTSLYFRDPDGHSLEVATPGLWKNW